MSCRVVCARGPNAGHISGVTCAVIHAGGAISGMWQASAGSHVLYGKSMHDGCVGLGISKEMCLPLQPSLFERTVVPDPSHLF